MSVLLLDGATGTELQRRGVPVRPPWWTSAALRTGPGRAVLEAIHADYADAGSLVLTANTFRCNLRAARRAGLDRAGAAALVRQAVRVARAASHRPARRVLVAGSIAPVEDCYRPDLVPDRVSLDAEHRWLARELVAAGVDIILVETMNSVIEARAAVAAARAAGCRTWVSFAVGPGARLLSGEPVAVAVRAAEQAGAEAVLVNCASLPETEASLRVLAETAGVPIGAYPNVEDRRGVAAATHVDRHLPALIGPAGLAGTVRGWIDRFGIGLVGGCCGTTPAHLGALNAEACFKKIW